MNFSPSCKAKYYQVSIDDTEIPMDWIEDFEIYFDSQMPCLTAYILLSDPVNYSSIITPESKIMLYVEDIFENYYLKNFKIYNSIEDTMPNGTKVQRLYLMDEFSYYLMKNFKTAGYNNKLLSEILQLAIDNALLTEQILKNTEFKLTPTTTEHGHIVISKNENFLSYLFKQLNKEGFMLYHTRSSIVLEKVKNLIPANLTEIKDPFSVFDHNGVYKNFIMSFRVNRSGKNNSLQQTNPSETVLAFDPETKTVKKMNQNLSDIYADVKLADDDKTKQTTEGSKYKTQVQLTDDNIYANTFLTYLKNTELEIVVPGNVNERELFTIINIEMNEVTKRVQTENEGSPQFSGKYIVTSFTDKFAAGAKYITKMKINRIDNGKVL